MLCCPSSARARIQLPKLLPAPEQDLKGVVLIFDPRKEIIPINRLQLSLHYPEHLR